MIFWHILLNNIVPIAVLIGIGILLQRAFRLDLRTLSRMNFYVFSPAIIFKMLYETEMSYAVMLQVLAFFFIFITVMYGAAELIVRIRRYRGGMPSAFRNSVIFYNSGNFGLPLNQLVFGGNPFTMSVQIIIMMMQGLLPATYGVYSVNAHKAAWKETMRTILSMPIIYVIPVALLLRGLEVPIPAALYLPVDYMARAFLATALLTLGVQLGSMKWEIRAADVLLSNMLRLCAAPAIGALIVWAMGIRGEMAAALILSCASPTSLNTLLIAVEFDNEPEFTSQTVLASTALSMITVTAVIYLLGV